MLTLSCFELYPRPPPPHNNNKNKSTSQARNGVRRVMSSHAALAIVPAQCTSIGPEKKGLQRAQVYSAPYMFRGVQYEGSRYSLRQQKLRRIRV